METTKRPSAAPGQLTIDPALIQGVYDLVDRTDLQTEDPSAELGELAASHGDEIYSELIYLLSHLRFDGVEAKRHWDRIVGIREKWQQLLGNVDLRVALVNYFVQVHRKLENPKIIEMKLFERTQDFAYRDELTGLHNYRMLREYLDQEVSRSERCGTPLSLVMIDVDHFKSYNDRNGHEAGNRALHEIAELLRATQRKGDVIARYGGEEFAMILPSTSKLEAGQVAESLREAVQDHPFFNEQDQPGGRVTVSLGVATCPADAADASQIVRHADRALYSAKSEGRNRIQLYGESRRSFARVEVFLEGTFRAASGKCRVLKTLNLSQGGILAVVDRELPAGMLMDIRLALPGEEKPIEAGGRVVHSQRTAEGAYHAAIRILDIEPIDHERLTARIRAGGENPA